MLSKNKDAQKVMPYSFRNIFYPCLNERGGEY